MFDDVLIDFDENWLFGTEHLIAFYTCEIACPPKTVIPENNYFEKQYYKS